MENTTSIYGTVPEKPPGAALDRRGLTCPAGHLKGLTGEAKCSEREWDRGLHSDLGEKKVFTEFHSIFNMESQQCWKKCLALRNWV